MCVRSPLICCSSSSLSSSKKSPAFVRRPVLSTSRLQSQQPAAHSLTLHQRGFHCRQGRHTGIRCTAEEIVGEAVADEPKAEDIPEDEESDATEEPSADDEEDNSEPVSPVDSIAAAAQDALSKGELDEEYLKDVFHEVGTLFAAVGTELADLESASIGLDKENSELQAKYMRLSADFDNFRKRADSERTQLRASATADVVLELLPMLDNFELARKQVVPENEGEEKINNSYQGLYKQTVDTLKNLGVEPVKAVGKPFDPNVHEAIMREPNNDVPDGTILEEFRRGFLLKGNLIRASMVKVSSSEDPPETTASSEETADSEGSDESTEPDVPQPETDTAKE